MMPEVRDLSDALPEMLMDPITGVGVVASRNRAPTGYDVVAQTTDGMDADLWKDGLFKSKVTRYLCFTRVFSKENDCFECTDWDMFREAATNGDTTDLEEYTSSVTSYISKCINDVTISKSITTRSNQKPWMIAKVHALLKSRDSAFRSGDKDALRAAQTKLSRAIREAKRTHSQRIHGHFQSSDALNSFYARFEAQNDMTARKTIPPPEDQVLCLTTADVRKTLCRVNPQKAAGPDNIPGRVLRECAEQLADIFIDIFNISLNRAQCTAPTTSSSPDDTTVVGLISKNNESAYREEVQRLTSWYKDNNLSLNVEKMKEMVVDFRKAQSDHSPLNINRSNMEIKSTKFLCVHLAEDLTWSLNTSSITKKAQQRLYFLRRLRKAHRPPLNLTTVYRGTIESILSSCITAWFGNCTASDHKTLQRIVRTAEKIIGVSPLSRTCTPYTASANPRALWMTPYTPHTHSSPSCHLERVAISHKVGKGSDMIYHDFISFFTQQKPAILIVSHLGNVLVDMKLIDIKDTLPVGFIPIQETVDTQEPAFRKRRLCIKFIPRDSTEAAICDIRILGRSKQAPPQYTFIGELNNMGIWYRMGKVPRTQDCSPTATTTSIQTVTNSTSVPVLPKHISMTLPASFRRSTTRPDYEHQSSNLYAISAMDGVPFVISEKFACASSDLQQIDLMGIRIKSLAEIEKEYEYSFRTEHSAAARLPPSPTRTSLGSEA
ncbi:hypothetical protein QTP86_018628 [Hemibagrus guttatus]|nr:hypothetical protein QTP86_018628 [Hemibagrus guttatus]